MYKRSQLKIIFPFDLFPFTLALCYYFLFLCSCQYFFFIYVLSFRLFLPFMSTGFVTHFPFLKRVSFCCLVLCVAVPPKLNYIFPNIVRLKEIKWNEWWRLFSLLSKYFCIHELVKIMCVILSRNKRKHGWTFVSTSQIVFILFFLIKLCYGYVILDHCLSLILFITWIEVVSRKLMKLYWFFFRVKEHHDSPEFMAFWE